MSNELNILEDVAVPTKVSDGDSQKKFLANYLRYCLAYIRLQTRSVKPRDFTVLNSEYFKLETILKLDLEDTEYVPLKFETLSKYAPDDVPEAEKEIYEKEKELSQNLQSLIRAYKSDEFTKEVILRFGKVTYAAKNPENDSFQEKNTYLFYVRALIGFDEKSYSIQITDPQVFYSLGSLEELFENQESYTQLISKFGSAEDDLSLPARKEVLESLSKFLIESLKLSNKVTFKADAISWDEVAFSLAPKAKYFLLKDLEALTKEDIDAEESSLAAWESDEDLNISDDSELKSGYLYFPFDYNQSQLRILKYLKNKAFIVEGPPGTGKSLTISNLLCHLAANGKKVLFVSQKEQAIRVVKERLESLNIDNLFGFISSKPQEGDYQSFSNSLERARVQMDINRYDKSSIDVNNKIPETFKSIAEQALLFDEALKQQSQFFTLSEELDEYPDNYPILSNVGSVSEVLSTKVLNELISLQNQLKGLEESRSLYASANKQAIQSLDKVTGTILPESWENNISKEIEEIINEQKTYEYQGMSKIKTMLGQWKVNKEHRDNYERLPKEIRDYCDEVKRSQDSLGSKIKKFDELLSYCKDKECDLEVAKTKTALEELSLKVQLSNESLNELATTALSATSPEEELERIFNYNRKLDEIAELQPVDYREIPKKIKQSEGNRKKLVSYYLANQIKKRVSSLATLRATERGLIASFARAIKKSKKAFKTFERLRNNDQQFEIVSDLVPIWIMNLEDASRIIPLEAGLFDYVILDEASQCNIAYAMPAMFRAKNAIVVGDSLQMRDDTNLFIKKSAFEDLANRFKIPEDRQIIGAQENIKSILDIGILRGFQSTALEEHYRSPEELIGFSNDFFYKPAGKGLKIVNNSYLTYEDTNRVILVHEIKHQPHEDEVTPKINVSEARAVVELIKTLSTSPKYKGKSIGVLSFFNEQADYLTRVIDEEFGSSNDIKVSIVEGIQGDERDIIIYSLVIHDPSQKNMYVPLTGEFGEIKPEVNNGRVNVAFSRAKCQVHCVTSLPVQEWPKGIWIDKYLNYAVGHGEVESQKVNLREFDSEFEREFFEFVRKERSHWVIFNQVPSCGYKIDFVLVNKTNDLKVAVECDGPTHFTDSTGLEHTESDIRRQLVLESAGWKFVRIRYSDWISEDFDKSVVIEEISGLIS